jgi:hypothetical protein
MLDGLFNRVRLRYLYRSVHIKESLFDLDELYNCLNNAAASEMLTP